MAIRFDATADVLSRTSDMLSFNANYTLMYWVQLQSDINAAGVLSALTNSAGTSIDGILIDSDGTTLVNYVDVPGVASGSLTVGTWVHLTQRRRSTTAHDLMTNGVTTTTRATAVSGSRTQNAMYLGSFGGAGNRCDVRIAGVKAWSTDLSDAEVLNEMRLLRPIRTADLYDWWPMIHNTAANAARAMGPSARHWTTGGTLTIEDGPPVSWGASPDDGPIVVASGTVAVGQASETNSAQPITSRVFAAVGQAQETDLAQAVLSILRGTVGQAQETDAAQAIGHSQGAPVGQAQEVDEAIALAARTNVGQASEANAAQPISAAQAAPVGQASETDLAQAITPRQGAQVGQATESSLAQPITTALRTAIGQASELNLAQAISARQGAAVGQAQESNSAQPITARQGAAVGQATETELAQPITAPGTTPVGQASEADEAQPIGSRLGAPAGQAQELDEAQPLGSSIGTPVGQASEADSAQPITVRSGAPLGQASELDEAQPVTQYVQPALGQATEVDEAQPIAAPSPPAPAPSPTPAPVDNRSEAYAVGGLQLLSPVNERLEERRALEARKMKRREAEIVALLHALYDAGEFDEIVELEA